MSPIRTPAAFALRSVCAAAALLTANAFAQTPPPPAPDGRPPVDGPAARPPAPDAARGPGARAPRGPRPGDEMRRAGAETTVTGRIKRWLVNPNGEVDGLLLDDGTQVAFPPHLSAGLTDAVKAKDTVEITGRRGENAKVVRASMIKNSATGRSVGGEPREPRDPADAARTPPQPRAVGSLTAMNASGRIDTLLYTGRGDINGALLQDGTIVRFPPRATEQMTDTLKPGAVLYARGYGTRSAQGNALEATALGPNAETARDVFTGPGAGPDAARPGSDAARPGPDGARPGPDGAAPPPPAAGPQGRPMPPARTPGGDRPAPDAPPPAPARAPSAS